MFSETLIIAILGLIFGSGGIGFGIFQWLRFRNKDKVDFVKAETDAFKTLREEAQSAVTQQMNQAKEILKLETGNSQKQLMIEIKDGIIDNYENNLKTVYTELGSIRKSEEICQNELKERKRVSENQQKEIDELKKQVLELQITSN